MTTDRRPVPDVSRRSERSRRAILTAALDLVGEVGYARLTVEGIAARAGVGKQTIYRWWPSKGAVLLDAFLSLSQTPDGELLPLPDTGDLAADLKGVMSATVDELNDPRVGEPMRALSVEVGHDEALASLWQERMNGPMTRLRRDRLRGAQRSGELPEGLDLDEAIDLLWGPLFHRWLLRTGPLTHAHSDRLVDAALDGLRGPDRKIPPARRPRRRG